MKVLLQYDKRDRDVPILIRLGAELAALGHEVEIEFQDLVWKDFSLNLRKLLKRFDVLVVPSVNLRRNAEPLFRKWINRGYLVHLPSEQYFQPVAFMDKMALNCPSTFRHTDLLLLYSGYRLGEWKEIGGVAESRIRIVGNPKATIVREWACKPREGKVVIISDFSEATVDHSAQYALFGYQRDIGREEYIAGVCSLFCEIANDLQQGGFEVTFRIHPGEDPAYYRQRLVDGVSISRREPLLTCVGDAEYIIQFTSTSYFETRHTEAQVLAVAPGEIPENVRKDYLSLFPWVSLEDLQTTFSLQFSEEVSSQVAAPCLPPFNMKEMESQEAAEAFKNIACEVDGLAGMSRSRLSLVDLALVCLYLVKLGLKVLVGWCCRTLPWSDQCPWCARIHRNSERFFEGEDYLDADISVRPEDKYAIFKYI